MRLFSNLLLIFTLTSTILFAVPNTSIIEQSGDYCEFRILFDEPVIADIGDGYFNLSMKDFGYCGDEHGPKLFAKAFNIAVPKDVDIEVALKSVEWSEWYDIKPSPLCIDDRFASPADYTDKKLYALQSGGSVKLASDNILRGVRIIGASICPVEYSSELGVRFMKKAEIRIEHRGGKLPFCEERLYHPVFAGLYRGLLVNPEVATPEAAKYTLEWDPDDGAELLVITRPDFADGIEPWIEWKFFMGMPTRVVTTSETGTGRNLVKNYIQDAYDTWDLPPAYVLLVSDGEYYDQIPCWSESEYGGYASDNQYGCVEDDDMYPDILVGRMSADYASELEVIIQKHLNFEMTPDTTDDWYARAVGTVEETDCTSPLGPDDSSYVLSVGYSMDACLAAGFVSAPLFRQCLGDRASDARPYVRAGCAFLTYRGNWTSDLSNVLYDEPTGRKAPVEVFITCGTAGIADGDWNPAETATRVGSVINPSGCVTFVGQSNISSNAVERSSLFLHIFEGFFENDLNPVGAAQLFGKLGLLSEFSSSWVSRFEYVSSMLLGSPDMLAWTAPIKYPEVTGYSIVPLGNIILAINVAADSANVKNARVCLHQEDRLSYALTDSNGNADIDFFVEPDGELYIVVTGPNIYPYVDTLEIITDGVAIFCVPTEFCEKNGDSDNLANPGETFYFIPMICNWGDETVAELTGIARVEDSHITFLDSTCTFADINPGDTVAGDTIKFTISSAHEATNNVRFKLELSGHPEGPWERAVVPNLKIHRFTALIENIEIGDPYPYGNNNGQLEPGELAYLYITLKNETQADVFSLSGELQDLEDIVVVQPFAEFGDLLRMSTAEATDIFIVSVSPLAITHEELYLAMELSGECPMYDYFDTFYVPITIEGSSVGSHTGPDEYGYYFYDDTDVWSGQAPDYIWEDISEIGDIFEEITDSDDFTTTIDLPFTMKFYDTEYDRYAFSTNGFLAVPWTTTASTYPSVFPQYGEPSGVIAPMWSDLAPHRDTCDIYYYHDEANHRFIVQYDKMEYYYGGGAVTYQITICQPEYYPTPTGDSDIFIYYKYVRTPSNFGVGIESPDESIGLQYCHVGSYSEGAMPIEDERALRITTCPPNDPNTPWLYYIDSLLFDDCLGNANGIIEPGDRISMYLRLKNNGNITALGTNGQALSPTYIEPIACEGLFGDIPPGEIQNNFDSPILFDVSSACPGDTVFYMPVSISANDDDYNTVIAIPICVGCYTSIENKPLNPRHVSVSDVYPNPFNSAALIEVYIGNGSYKTDANISVLSLDGRKIEKIYDGFLQSGQHTFRLDFGKSIASGIYFIEVSLGEESYSRKVLFIR